MKLMSKLNIDGLQLFLMLASLLVAFIVPFRLFFLVYAVLGPIHYLTEINWLRALTHRFLIILSRIKGGSGFMPF